MNQLEGSGPPPASKEHIDNLPSVTIGPTHLGKSHFYQQLVSKCQLIFNSFNGQSSYV